MKTLALIPARGGSKGIKNKNIKDLNGAPLIHYTLRVAREVFDDVDICISTDDQQIKSCSEKLGISVPFLRPKTLANDNTPTEDVIRHAISYYQEQGRHYDCVCLLQPTSPFRTESHIRDALRLFNLGVDMVVSVKETKANPYSNLYEEDDRGVLRKSKASNFVRRQDTPKVWELNGSIYVINIRSLNNASILKFQNIIKYVMDPIYSVDIDDPLDWEMAEFIQRSFKV